MASTTKNLMGIEIAKGWGGGRVVLTLRWTEAGIHWRRIQAETFRIAGRVCEASETEEWVVDLDAGCSILGKGLLATTVSIELFKGTEDEAKRATDLLRKVARDIKG